MAVAFHPDFEYVVVGDDDPHGDAYIVESRRHGPVVEETGLEGSQDSGAHSRARSWSRSRCSIRSSTARLCRCMANYVTAEDGTGAVHTAPGHGREDYHDRRAVRHRYLLPGG